MILAILLFALAAATVFSLFRRGAWPSELLTHFRPQMIATGLVLALAALALADWLAAAVGLALAVLNWAAMPDRKWLKPNASIAGQPGITVVWANVWKKRAAMERTVRWAEDQRADLILLGEFPVGSANDPALAPDYPHRLDAAPQGLSRAWTSRVVAFSKLPLADTRILPAPGDHQRPFLAFGVDVPGGRLKVFAVHPNPPMLRRLQRDRDAMIDQLRDMANSPFLIAGDFNAAPWCPALGRIPGEHVGSIFKQTWLSVIPLLGLAIDHIFVSKDVLPSSYRIGPALGSDHRALLACVHLSSAP